MQRYAIAAGIALLSACAVSEDAAAAVQIFTVSGTLNSGSNSAGSPFGAANTSLIGTSYKLTFSYDPTAFAGLCGSSASAYCYFELSAARKVSSTLTVGSTTKQYSFETGNFALNASGNDRIDFTFTSTAGDSFSGAFVDGNNFFASQTDVRSAVFKTLTDQALSYGGFQQNGRGYDLGANPTTLSTSSVQPGVPEPATWALMLAGFLLVGGATRYRKRTWIAKSA